MRDIDNVGPWGWLYVILFCLAVICIGGLALNQ